MSIAQPRLRGVNGTPAPGAAPADVVEREISLHGQRVTYLESGANSGGPVLVLLHGLAGSSTTWRTIMPSVGARAHVLAPDLLGHGRSAKPHDGDYSLGAYAAGLRDLLLALGLDRASVVGHSFGGGVAMQFAYQFPELTERLILVASGGLGREVTPALRAATLPGTALTLEAVARLTPRWLGRTVHRVARAVPGISRPELDEIAHAVAALADPGARGARGAFVHTVRGALDLGGQRLNGLERLRLVSGAPVLLVAGTEDLCIPAEHTTRAHEALPGSRLEHLAAGHFPHREHPERFATLVLDFLATTAPSHPDPEDVRRRLRTDDPTVAPAA